MFARIVVRLAGAVRSRPAFFLRASAMIARICAFWSSLSPRVCRILPIWFPPRRPPPPPALSGATLTPGLAEALASAVPEWEPPEQAERAASTATSSAVVKKGLFMEDSPKMVLGGVKYPLSIAANPQNGLGAAVQSLRDHPLPTRPLPAHPYRGPRAPAFRRRIGRECRSRRWAFRKNCHGAACGGRYG